MPCVQLTGSVDERLTATAPPRQRIRPASSQCWQEKCEVNISRY